ncbi:6-phosphogluconolactonase [Myxococcota bacterium]|nr:6-phosphogluconolactonase [Myxococcota bacterium]MBU1381920.1 6-phosphogluconolactonase [Myxococcota bacterium]MBU1497821.1 6-phosphogluconolactonase [Myxococcota bacterium]
MKCNIIEYPNEKMWEIFGHRFSSLLNSERIHSMALCGGRIIKPLAESLCRKKIEIKNMEIFLTDERLTATISELNYVNVKNDFINYANDQGLLEDTVFYNPWKSGNFDFDMSVPPLDLAILSSGEDGHFASVFPGSNFKVNNKYHKVIDAPKPPSERATLSAEMIFSSKHVMLFFVGESKLNAFRKFSDSDSDYNFPDFPVGLFRDHPNCTVFSSCIEV